MNILHLINSAVAISATEVHNFGIALVVGPKYCSPLDHGPPLIQKRGGKLLFISQIRYTYVLQMSKLLFFPEKLWVTPKNNRAPQILPSKAKCPENHLVNTVVGQYPEKD